MTVVISGALCTSALGACGGGEKHATNNDDIGIRGGLLGEVCNKSTRFPKTAAHGGNAPHPIVIVEGPNGNASINPDEQKGGAVLAPPGAGNFRTESTKYDLTPVRFFNADASNKGFDPLYNPIDGNSVQLVGCSSEVTGSEVATGVTCTFSSGDIPLFTATWSIAIYETRTAKKVAMTTVVSSEKICPQKAETNFGSDQKVFSTPTPGEYKTALKQYVEG